MQDAFAIRRMTCFPTTQNRKRTTLSASRFRFFRFVKVATTSLLAVLFCLRGYLRPGGSGDVSEVADPEGGAMEREEGEGSL